ncbi:hypothetical protein [Escherichia phage IMM-001]|nr:hypothetical protein [Escherichia phage IMM-001]
MIYIHTYYTGKFNSVKHVRVYEDIDEVLGQCRVLGGDIKICRLIQVIL